VAQGEDAGHCMATGDIVLLILAAGAGPGLQIDLMDPAVRLDNTPVLVRTLSHILKPDYLSSTQHWIGFDRYISLWLAAHMWTSP